jgi:chromosome segregation ATPase
MEVSLRLLAKDRNVDAEKWSSLNDPLTLGALAWYLRESSTMTEAQKTFVNETIGADLAAFLKILVSDNAAMTLLKVKLDTAPGRYDELIRMAKSNELSGSALKRAEAAEEAAGKAKADAASTQSAFDELKVQLAEVKKSLAETRKDLEGVKANRDALQKELDTLKDKLPPGV